MTGDPLQGGAGGHPDRIVPKPGYRPVDQIDQRFNRRPGSTATTVASMGEFIYVAIPEPSTFVMMLGAIGLFLVIGRRVRKS